MCRQRKRATQMQIYFHSCCHPVFRSFSPPRPPTFTLSVLASYVTEKTGATRVLPAPACLWARLPLLPVRAHPHCPCCYTSRCLPALWADFIPSPCSRTWLQQTFLLSLDSPVLCRIVPTTIRHSMVTPFFKANFFLL